MNVSKNVFHIMRIQSLIVKPQSYSRALYVNRGRVIGARKCCGRISKWRPLSVSYIGHPLRLIQYFSCILPLTKDESWALRCPVDIHNQSPEDLKEGLVASFQNDTVNDTFLDVCCLIRIDAWFSRCRLSILHVEATWCDLRLGTPAHIKYLLNPAKPKKKEDGFFLIRPILLVFNPCRRSDWSYY